MTEDRIATSISLFCALLLAVACGSSARTRDVTFRVAGPAGGPICDIEMSVPEPCITVVVYEANTRNQLPLVVPDDEDGTEYFKLRFEGGGVAPRWDVRVAPGQLIDVEVLVYENDGAARYGAFLEDVDPSAGEVNVRLYPFREWACPGSAGTPRALHRAVAINEHQVLIVGGVSGGDLDPLSARDPRAFGGALPVDSIELYDGRTHRFTTLRIESPDGEAFFRRVLFDAILVGENRVRVIGGLTGPGGSPLLHFDNLGTYARFGSPFLPSVGAQVGSTVDLVIDAEDGSVQIVDATEIAPRGGLLDVSAFYDPPPPMRPSPVEPALVLIGLAPEGMMFAPSVSAYAYTREGQVGEIWTLANPRMGATAHPFGESFVVWGGNVGHGEPSTAASLAATAAERLTPGGEIGVPIAVGGGVPMPSAFHSGTNLGGGRALIAGGYLVAPTGDVLSAAPPASIYFLSIDAGPTFDVRPVATPVEHVNTILHTATTVPGLGVALVGGAGVDSTGDRLAPQGQAVFVNGAGYVEVDGLTTPRWGHTATVLSGHRLLVVGGFARDTETAVPNGLVAVQSAELFYWDEAPRDLLSDECATHMLEPDDAAVGGMDAGLPPPADAGTDAGPPTDAGVDAVIDAG